MVSRFLAVIIFLILVFNVFAIPVNAAESVRIKDITHIEGIRDNQLIGYGVVVGLPGTGDNSKSTQYSNQAMLANLGTVVDGNDIKKGNTAAVIITATIPPFAKNGDRIDVTVSSMADAKSLEGGILVQTQLLAANGEVVAVAQGPLSTGGTSVSASGSSVRTSITTSGRIPNGAIVERDMNTEIGGDTDIKIILNAPDFTMAAKVAKTVSNTVAPAKALDPSTISVKIPPQYDDDRISFISILENLRVSNGDTIAKVVINERTGTIVIGNDVKLLPAAVTHGNLIVTVTTRNDVSQPGPYSNGTTQVLQNSDIKVSKQAGKMVEIPANATLNDLVRSLNAIGATPYDLITIIQALKEAGSLQATLEII